MSRGRPRTFTDSGFPIRMARDGSVTSDGRIIHLSKKYATKITTKKRRRSK